MIIMLGKGKNMVKNTKEYCPALLNEYGVKKTVQPLNKKKRY